MIRLVYPHIGNLIKLLHCGELINRISRIFQEHITDTLTNEARAGNLRNQSEHGNISPYEKKDQR